MHVIFDLCPAISYALSGADFVADASVTHPVGGDRGEMYLGLGLSPQVVQE